MEKENRSLQIIKINKSKISLSKQMEIIYPMNKKQNDE